MSPELLRRPSIAFMIRQFGLKGDDEELERGLAVRLLHDLNDAQNLDAAVVLAFDAVHDQDGTRRDDLTHLEVSNAHVEELSSTNPRALFGASIHPYRRDAVVELERCVRKGAVLVKWLPITQGIDPSSPLCDPFYEAMAHHGIPLLSHTGGERSLPSVFDHVADPSLLTRALERGVTVIAAHCGTRSVPGEPCFASTFIRMARRYERFFGDTSALNLPTRSYVWPMLLDDDTVRHKLVHGSDWPIIPLPDPRRLPLKSCLDSMKIRNWFDRDASIKRSLGLVEPEYWNRAATILGASNRLIRGQRIVDA